MLNLNLNVKMLSYVHRGTFKTKLNICDGAFLQKCLLADVWLGSNYVSGSLDAPCKMVPLHTFILYYYVIASLYFVRIWQE